MLQDVFTAFGLQEGDAILYMLLLEHGALPVSAIGRRIGLPRTTLYGHLDRLKYEGFVSEHTKSGVKHFTAEAPDRLNLLYRQKLDRLQNAQRQFEKSIPDLLVLGPEGLSKPRLQYYGDANELQNMMNDILLLKDTTVYSFWPVKSMIELMTVDYLTYFNIERIKRNIFLQAIWPPSQVIDVRRYPFMGSGKPFLRDARVAPNEIDAKLSYMIYGDKVMFTSSRRESFGFIIQSRDMADMLVDQFKMIWSLSRPIVHPEKDARRFFDELKVNTEDTE